MIADNLKAIVPVRIKNEAMYCMCPACILLHFECVGRLPDLFRDFSLKSLFILFEFFHECFIGNSRFLLPKTEIKFFEVRF